MTIADATLNYYSSKDFKNQYLYYLQEDFGNNEGDMIKRIMNLINEQTYELESSIKGLYKITREQAKKIYDFIYENMDVFTDRYRSYYVGSTSLTSISFGEQEEQLTDVYNPRTGSSYNVKYLSKVFNKAGFYVTKGYAYYNLTDDGLHINLLNNPPVLEKLLDEIITPEQRAEMVANRLLGQTA